MPDCWSEHDYSEPLYVAGPDESGFYMGCAQWTPKREFGQTERDCQVCGGLLVFLLADPCSAIPIAFDRRRDFDPELHGLMIPPDDAIGSGCCGACLRWAQDNRLARLMDAEYARRGTNAPVLIEA